MTESGIAAEAVSVRLVLAHALRPVAPNVRVYTAASPRPDRRTRLQTHLLTHTDQSSYGVPIQTCRSRHGPNTFPGQPAPHHLIDVHHSYLPVCHPCPPSGTAWHGYWSTRGWVND